MTARPETAGSAGLEVAYKGIIPADRERAEVLATALLAGASNYEIALQFAAHRTAGQTELAAEVLRLRTALAAILTAPMIDHQDSSKSAYGIARAALSRAGKSS